MGLPQGDLSHRRVRPRHAGDDTDRHGSVDIGIHLLAGLPPSAIEKDAGGTRSRTRATFPISNDANIIRIVSGTDG
jgi:hypothetical protein